MLLSEVFITLHTYYPHPLYSSPIPRFYFTSLRFYSTFASPSYHCYNILDGFYPPFFFRLYYVSFLLHPFRYFSPSQCLPLSTSLTLPFYCLCIQLVFSHPITSLHPISAIFKICFPHHHTLRRAKPETSYY